MRALLKKILAVWVFFAPGAFGAGEGRKYDFQFKGMDLRKVILSIASLENRSVQFSQTIAPRAIDVSLKQVTPGFALRLVTDSYGYVYVLKGNVYHVMTAAERGPSASPMVLIPMRNVLAADIEDNVRTFIGTSGTFSINKSMNAIVVSAQEEVITRLRRVVEQLDQETTQIFIEAKIVETSTTFSRGLGIEWGPDVVSRPAVNGVSFRSPGNDDTLRVGFTAGVAGTSLQARISAGERSGDVKIISQPKITTLNGVTASISSNLTFNIRTLAATGASSASVGAIQAVKAGLNLQVTPFLVSDQRVRLQIVVTKSDPDFSAKIDGIPGISDNSASTSLIVGDGQVASIGGLVSNRSSTASQGVPFLNKIPILGSLFGSLEKENKETELMIFLTPSLYRGTARITPFVSKDDAVVPEEGDSPKHSALDGGIGAAPAPVIPPTNLLPQLPTPGAAPAPNPVAPKEGSLLPPGLTPTTGPIPAKSAADPNASLGAPPKEALLQAPAGLTPTPAPVDNQALALPPDSGKTLLPPILPPTTPTAKPVLPLAPVTDPPTKADGALLQLPNINAAPVPTKNAANRAGLDELLAPIPSTAPALSLPPAAKAPPP